MKEIVPHVRLIHSVASDSALAQLAKHAPRRDDFAVLVEVNVAGEASKSGIAPAELAAFVERCPVPVAGLMTMPPAVDAARGQPPALRRAARAGGRARAARTSRWAPRRTTRSAVEEGATIVRLGLDPLPIVACKAS